jgi:hypothetical protein
LSRKARSLSPKQDVAIVDFGGIDPGIQIPMGIFAVELEDCDLNSISITSGSTFSTGVQCFKHGPNLIGREQALGDLQRPDACIEHSDFCVA